MTRTLLLALTLLFSAVLAQGEDYDKLMYSYNFQRGIEALINEQYADAFSYFQQEVAEHPDNGYAYYYIACINYHDDQAGAAIDALDKCLKVLPKKNKEWRAAANNAKGNIYLSLGDTVKALEFKTEAIKQLPNEAKYWNFRAQIYDEMGKHDLALADYKKITEIELGNGMGQDDYVVVEKGSDKHKEQVFSSVEQMPVFPGGDAALMEYLRSQIQYPPTAAKNNVQGRVIVQFVVDKTGQVGEVNVVRSVDKDLDGEAVRVCKSLPKFTPGRQNGQPVNVWYTLPITFSLGRNSKDTIHPECLSSSNNHLQIQKVSVQENQTVIQFACARDPKYFNEWIRINPASYIEDAAGMRYKLLNAEGIAIKPDVTWFAKDEQIHYFILYFQAIPMTTTVINFKEPGDGWQILGIQLKQ